MQDDALARARRSLVGLAVGDCLGERYFGPPDRVLERIGKRELPVGPWHYTDDTEMALSVFAMLRDHKSIDQDKLALAFAKRMGKNRGYGHSAFEILWAIRQGANWSRLSQGAFGGTGSFGNGAAMRVAPLGAYFADDIDACIVQARLQSEITHSHPEGIAGAIGVAVATALVWQQREELPSSENFLASVLAHVPPGKTYDGIQAAAELDPATRPDQAAARLGNGSEISAADTVPYCLWVVSRHLQSSYEDAFWVTVAALGDRDTTCAIVGGILGVNLAPPIAWVESCEGFEP